MKKALISFFIFSTLVGVCGYLMAATPPPIQPGTLIAVGSRSAIYQDTSGNLVFVDANSPGAVPLNLANASGYTITSTTSFLSAGVGSLSEYFYLSGSTTAFVGSVLIATSPVNGKMAVAVSPNSGTADLTSVIGVALAQASTGTVVNVATNGFALVLTTGTVNPGNVLTSTSTAYGYLAASTSTIWGADFGVALSTGNAAGGLTLIKIRK